MRTVLASTSNVIIGKGIAKRLKQESMIHATAALLDGAKIGRPLSAFVHVDTTSWAVMRQPLKLKELLRLRKFIL